MLGNGEEAALEELGQWWEDLVDRSIGSRGLVLATPRGWGRTTVVERFRMRVEADDDRFGIVVSLPGSEAPSGAGLQVAWLDGLIRQAGLSERWKEIAGVDRPEGIFEVSASLAALGLLTVSGQVVSLLAGLGLRKLAADRDDSDAGPADAVERLGRILARQSSRVPLVVLIDDADMLDPAVMERFVDSVIARWDGQALVVVVADPTSELAVRLSTTRRYATLDRVVTIDVSADMGEMARRRLIESQACGWPEAAIDRLAERSSSFKDVWRVLAARGSADVAEMFDRISQPNAVDVLVEEILNPGSPTGPAAVVAWSGGIMHRSQLEKVLAQLPATLATGDEWQDDPWIAGFGAFVRMADQGYQGRACERQTAC